MRELKEEASWREDAGSFRESCQVGGLGRGGDSVEGVLPLERFLGRERERALEAGLRLSFERGREGLRELWTVFFLGEVTGYRARKKSLGCKQQRRSC